MSKREGTTDGLRQDMKDWSDREGLEGIERKKDVVGPEFFRRGGGTPRP